MHAWNYKNTAVHDHAAGTDYTLWKHSNGAGEGRRCLRLVPANLREAGSADTVYEVEPHTRHNGGQVDASQRRPGWYGLRSN